MTSQQAMLAPAQAADPPPAMSLSVILPNYNHGKFVARALHALATQTPAAHEIIVVDDGSTDNSVEVIEALQRRYPAIRLIRNQTNQGIVASVKTALEVATGEFLLFAGSDDFVLPGLFGRALAALTDYPNAAFFCGGVVLVDSDDRVIGLRPVTAPQHHGGYLSPADVRRVIRSTDFWALGTATVYRRRLLAAIGYFEPRLGSLGDTLANRLLAFQHGFYFDPAVLAAYNKDPTSFSARSASSVKDVNNLLAAARSWMAENLPADIRDEHGPLFERRMRFSFARLRVIWRDGRRYTGDVAEILNCGALDRAILKAASGVPFGSRFLALAWIALRRPPFSLTATVEAWWRARRFMRVDRAEIEREIDAVNKLGGGDTPPAR
jgi:glycosyltransferase involved in cell wall biosynthesis